MNECNNTCTSPMRHCLMATPYTTWLELSFYSSAIENFHPPWKMAYSCKINMNQQDSCVDVAHRLHYDISFILTWCKHFIHPKINASQDSNRDTYTIHFWHTHIPYNKIKTAYPKRLIEKQSTQTWMILNTDAKRRNNQYDNIHQKWLKSMRINESMMEYSLMTLKIPDME